MEQPNQQKTIKQPVIQYTDNLENIGIKALVYGAAGVGKTVLCATAPNPIILSAEAGLLSLKSLRMPYITINTVYDLGNAYDWLTETDEGRSFDTICIDSISEICEVILANEKPKYRDARQAYGSMNDFFVATVRLFRDIPKRNVLMTAKLDRMEDDEHKVVYAPALPGKKSQQDLPYFFDEVFAYRIGKTKDGKETRLLQTQSDINYLAKDRSGKLDVWEIPNLTNIFQKIINN